MSAWIDAGTANAERSVVERQPPPPCCRTPVVEQHADELAEEERIALGRLGQRRGDRVGKLGRVEQPLEQPPALVRRQGLELDHLRGDAIAQQGAPLLEQLGTREAQQEDGLPVTRPRHGLDQAEERRLGPVHVLEEDHDGPLDRERLQQPSHGPGRLLR